MNILISGVTGAMGQVLVDVITDSKHQVVAGFANKSSDKFNFPVYTSLTEVKEEVDLVIDFSQPASLEVLLDYGKSNNIPLVIATTGYTPEEEEAIQKASDEIPILFSKNMSLGINMMEKIVHQLAHALPQFDIEIIEKHHRYKKDSPSGTAKMLVEAAKTGRSEDSPVLEGRSGHYDERVKNEIGVMAVRGGTIVGEHTVLFAGEDEVIEIKHSAQSKKVFANGALTAAEFLAEQAPGFYDMNDVLGGE